MNDGNMLHLDVKGQPSATDSPIRKPILGSIVVSIPACHAGDRGSIPRRGGFFNCISVKNKC